MRTPKPQVLEVERDLPHVLAWSTDTHSTVDDEALIGLPHGHSQLIEASNEYQDPISIPAKDIQAIKLCAEVDGDFDSNGVSVQASAFKLQVGN